MKLWIDCDPGVDDALALILAAARPEVEILGISTVAGNVGVDITTRNARYVLSLLGIGAPVIAGAPAPLSRPLRDAGETHGSDGLGNLGRFHNPDGSPKYPLPLPVAETDEAADAIIEAIGAYPGEITLVATGPLTNLARVVEKATRGLWDLAGLVIMGGGYRVECNVKRGAEYNFWCDPEAAATVLALPIPKTLVGLDVTYQVVLSREMVEERFQPIGTAVSEFVCDATEAYAAFDTRTYSIRGSYVHDAVAVATALDPTVVTTEPMSVHVETTGKCVIADDSPNGDVATSVDGEHVLNMLLKAIM